MRHGHERLLVDVSGPGKFYQNCLLTLKMLSFWDKDTAL